MPSDLRAVDPADLRLPASRSGGPDPFKLHQNGLQNQLVADKRNSARKKQIRAVIAQRLLEQPKFRPCFQATSIYTNAPRAN